MPVNFQPANKHTACPSLQQKNMDKFRKLHDEDASIDIDVLRKISWQGIPQGNPRSFA